MGWILEQHRGYQRRAAAAAATVTVAITAAHISFTVILQPADPDQGPAPQWTLDQDYALLLLPFLLHIFWGPFPQVGQAWSTLSSAAE